MKKIRIAELFCGPGGLTVGAKMASGFKHTWLVDKDSDSLQTIKKNFPNELTINEDVKKFCQNSNLRKIKKLKGSFEGLVFGFPCNDFSIVGKKRGFKGKFGGLYIYACKVLKFFKPKFFLAENVSNIATSNKKSLIYKNFQKILHDFRKLGYEIKMKKIKFEKLGVPQTRHRLIILGYLKNSKYENFKFPQEDKKIVKCSTILNKILKLKNLENNETHNHSKNIIKRLKKIKFGQNVWDINGLPNVKKARMSNIYKKLHPSKPAYTVTGSGGGGTHMYHYKFPRALTNRERASLQTFPLRYKFHGNKTSVRKQIGMAVPPLAAKAIFSNIKKCLR